VNQASLQTWAGGLRWATGIAGAALTVYVTLALFGFVRSSSQHYAAFTFAVMLIAGLISVRAALQERVADARSRVFWPKLAIALAGLAMAAGGGLYILVNATRLEVAAPFFDRFDMTVGMIFTVGVLILTWLHWGPVLTLFIVLAIVYFFYGHLIEHPLLTHPEYDPNFVMNYIGLGTTQGFFWFAQTAVDDIYYLVLYASVLFGIGMLHSIIEMGKAMGNRVAGGAAGPAVIGSGVVSMVMGVAVSNVVLTGRFTIPMMKKYGYSPAMAGAIEAAASTSGQIMPPVLGLAAFIIASFLSMKYIDIVKAAVIPGALYMTGIWIAVMVYARRHRLPKLREPVDVAAMWRTLPAFLVSFVAVCWLLLGYYSPSMAGFAGCLIALALAAFQGRHRPSGRQLAFALEEGVEMMALLAVLLIAIGPLGQAFLTTNLSGRLGTLLIAVLPDNAFILLAGAAVLALILGMGLPTPVAYLVVALALVPFLQQLGVKPLLAHYFVFYFAVYSALSPPIAVAALAGAKIAGASFWDTAKESLKLAASTFIIPFAFVYRPQLLEFPDVGWNVVPVVVEILLIQWITSIALFGYFRRTLTLTERVPFYALTILGYWAMITEAIHSTLVFVGAAAALFAVIALRRPAPAARSVATNPEGGGS
jgi:TRAP transporter 4TM/12TM fusion protein